MFLKSILSVVLLGLTCVAAEYSEWGPIRTDDAAWQAACTQGRRVGTVCLKAEYGDRNLYHVQRNAAQNVVFSGKGHYFNAYCPNLDKNEKPYSLAYGEDGGNMAYYRILGRHADQRCCFTQYIDSLRNPDGIQYPDEVKCIAPGDTPGGGDSFPYKHITY